MTWIWEMHLKKSWVSHDGKVDHNYKISAAWITRLGKRKWALSFADNHEPKQFTTLKAAKAYALATVILGA
jgi:hypothetical protein